MYGAQTKSFSWQDVFWFENDVEMYGAQTRRWYGRESTLFENDVEMYGAQTINIHNIPPR